MSFRYINTDYIESVSGGDWETVTELIGMFREQVAEMADEMNTLLEKGDYFNLGLLAHKAKSSVSIMGMADLAVLLKTFELVAKESKETEKYPEYIQRFREDTGNAVKELEEFMANH